MNELKLWWYDWEFDYSRLTGIFKATQSQIEELFGKEVYLGEMEGKHSGTTVTIEQTDFTEISVSNKDFDKIPEIGINIYKQYKEQ